MKRIEQIREEMKKRGVDLWIGHSYDAHGSEYICDHDNVIKFASGFTGENGILAIFADAGDDVAGSDFTASDAAGSDAAGKCSRSGAYLWVDGRFFIQAPQETEGTGITIMKMGESGVPKFEEWLEKVKTAERIERTEIENKGREADDFVVSEDPELVAPVWADRPARPCNKIWIHAREFEERSTADKLKLVREEVATERGNSGGGKPALWIRALDEIAWLTNLRGSDIDYNPVFFSYMYISEEKAVLYVQPDALDDEVEKYLQSNGIEIKDYADAVKPDNAVESNIVSRLKACKSEAEAKHMEECNLRDALHLTRFIYKIKRKMQEQSERPDKKEQPGMTGLTELTAGEILDSMRSEDEKFLGLSFPTIAAYGEHGAIVHYTADGKTSIELKDKSFLLVDSGAHYLDGTTDVTRTIALGGLSEEEKKNYTLVMMGMLRLMNAKFSADTDSVELDAVARKPLHDYNLDFNHGTGHGVGYVNMVHEGPVRIRNKKNGFCFKPGMITSDEPGVYIEKSHGVRIENMLLCVEASEGLAWRNLTWVPLENEAVDKKYMADGDIENYNNYQSEVYKRLSPHMCDEERKWLKKVCSMI